MKTVWDYSALAEAYLARPQYSTPAINAIFSIASINKNSLSCDIGAGVGHLTLHYEARKFNVIAIEPNDNMRAIGKKRTNCEWVEGTGEETKQANESFDLVTFGSSFNVCDRTVALKESSRILKSSGWFGCLWNHRDLEDPIQSSIESLIKSMVPDYGYGTRREDQSDVINNSNLFNEVIQLNAPVAHEQSISECIRAWESHATLQRQAAENFKNVIQEIRKFLEQSVSTDLSYKMRIPYQTRIWLAQKKN
jgi:ubiquinone/menaquinone biosynthesis C-methylase UbiE